MPSTPPPSAGEPHFGTGTFVAGSFYSLRVFSAAYSRNLDKICFAPTWTRNRVYSHDGWHHANCGRWSIDPAKVMAAIKRPGIVVDAVTAVKWSKGEMYFRIAYFADTIGEHVNKYYSRELVVEHVKAKDVLISTRHPAPYLLCSCGFYSFYRFDDIVENTGYVNAQDAFQILAVVENAGRVIHGSLGLRSQRMRIKAWMWLPFEVGRVYRPPAGPFVPIAGLHHHDYGGIDLAEEGTAQVMDTETLEAGLREIAPQYYSLQEMLLHHPLSDPDF